MIQKIKETLSSDSHFNDLIKGSAITFVLKMCGMGLSYVVVFLISKKLGAEGVGFFQVILQSIIVLGMIMGLGMNISVLRYVGQFNNNNRPKMHILYKHFIRTIAPLTVALAVLIYFGAEYIVNIIGKDQEYIEALKLVGIVLPFFTINIISVEFIRGLKKLQISELIRSVIRPLFMTIGILTFFIGKLTKLDIIYLLVIGIIINSIASRWTIWRILKKVPKKNVIFKRGELLRTSYPMLMTGLSSTLLGAMPIFFLDYYTTQVQAGIFSVAFRLASLVSLVLLVVNTISAPKFAELYWIGKMKELQKLILQSTKLMFWIALFVVVLIIITGEALLQFFGDEFQQGYLALLFLSFGQLANAATGSVGTYMNMCGMHKELRVVIMFFVGVSLVVYLALGVSDILNFLYVASVSACVNAIMNFYLSIKVQRATKIKTYYLPKL